MAKLPTDQRLQGAMKVCNADQQGEFHQDTSLLSWYMNTLACIQAYSAKAPQAASSTSPAPVQGLWRSELKTELILQPWLTPGLY